MLMVRVVPVFLLACANAGGSSPPVDSRGVDAPRTIDAPQLIDAPPLVDARPPTDAPVDAPPGSNFTCDVNPDCTIAGECCLRVDQSVPGFCVAGSIFLGACVPDF